MSSYTSTWEFLRTLEKCKKHLAAPRTSLCISLVFLKIPVYNSTMHSDEFFISLIKHRKSMFYCFSLHYLYFIKHCGLNWQHSRNVENLPAARAVFYISIVLSNACRIYQSFLTHCWEWKHTESTNFNFWLTSLFQKEVCLIKLLINSSSAYMRYSVYHDFCHFGP